MLKKLFAPSPLKGSVIHQETANVWQSFLDEAKAPLPIKAFTGAVVQTVKMKPGGKLPEHGKRSGVVHPSQDPLLGTYRRDRERLFQIDHDSTGTLVGRPARLEGVWLYGGLYWSHFGHLLIETSARLWAWNWLREQKGHPPFEGIVFAPIIPKNVEKIAEKPSNFAHDILAHFGLNADTVRFAHKPLQPDVLIAPRQAGGLDMVIQPVAQEQVEKTCHIKASATPKGRVFVSRRHYRHLGSTLGEGIIERTLEKAGFTVFFPEKHSVEEQLETYANARQLVFAEGSALHLMLLLPSFKGSIHILNRRAMRTFRIQLASQGIRFTEYPCLRQFTPIAQPSRDLADRDVRQTLEMLAFNMGIDLDIPSSQAVAADKADHLNDYLDIMLQRPGLKAERAERFAGELRESNLLGQAIEDRLRGALLL